MLTLVLDRAIFGQEVFEKVQADPTLHQMVRLDPEQKRLLASLRSSARDIFYKALQPFKKACNNYRDDHDQFRQLTQARSVLELGAKQVVVHLMPQVGDPPQVRRIIGTVLDDLNAQEPGLPDGSGRRLKLRLAQRSEMKLSLHPSSCRGRLGGGPPPRLTPEPEMNLWLFSR